MIILLWYTYLVFMSALCRKYIAHVHIWCFTFGIFRLVDDISKSEIFDCILVNDAGFLTYHVVLTEPQASPDRGDVTS
jgi:hypothetical protein